MPVRDCLWFYGRCFYHFYLPDCIGTYFLSKAFLPQISVICFLYESHMRVKRKRRCCAPGERHCRCGSQAKARTVPKALVLGCLLLNTLQMGPKLYFKSDGHSCWEFRIRSLFMGRFCLLTDLPASSPCFEFLLCVKPSVALHCLQIKVWAP